MVKQFSVLLKSWRQVCAHGVCWLCEQTVPLVDGLCTDCAMDLPYLPSHSCKPSSINGHPCRAWFAPLSYQTPVDRWFAPFKYAHQPGMAKHFAPLIAAHVVRCYRINRIFLPQALIPIPLSTMRWWQRGYNQAGLLAEEVGRLLDIPVLYPLRRRYTRASTAMGARERAQNLENAFRVAVPLELERIALVDDIITSGATLGAAGRTLHQSQRCIIDAWAFAYTP